MYMYVIYKLQSYVFWCVKQNKSPCFCLKAAPLRPFCRHGCSRVRNVLIPSALQKAVFWRVKGGILHAERRPFANQKAAFRKNAVCHVWAQGILPAEHGRREMVALLSFLAKNTGKLAYIPVLVFSCYKIIKFIDKIVLYVDSTRLNEFFCSKNTFLRSCLIVNFVYP